MITVRRANNLQLVLSPLCLCSKSKPRLNFIPTLQASLALSAYKQTSELDKNSHINKVLELQVQKLLKIFNSVFIAHAQKIICTELFAGISTNQNTG